MRSAGALLALGMVSLAWLAGCAVPASAPSGPPPEAVVSSPPEPSPAPDSGPGSAVAAEPAAAVAARIRAPAPAPAPVTDVAILFAGGTPHRAGIAARIGDGLTGTGWRVRRIDLDRDDLTAALSAAAQSDIVAAVGPDALALARQQFVSADIVFSQVLEPGSGSDEGRRIVGVAPMPPPALQFAAWAEVDPGLERIGLITSAGFAGEMAGVEQAAAAIGAELVQRVSSSDRETLYHFRRLAPEIDGLWLAPDSGILSTAVIGEVLAIAAELGIGVLVFNENLLDAGGLISVGASAGHVAARVVETIERLRSGGALPAEIPLSEGTVRVNPAVATGLGLPAAGPTEWVIRARH